MGPNFDTIGGSKGMKSSFSPWECLQNKKKEKEKENNKWDDGQKMTKSISKKNKIFSIRS